MKEKGKDKAVRGAGAGGGTCSRKGTGPRNGLRNLNFIPETIWIPGRILVGE